MNGKLVVFEGIDGCGKTTMVNELEKSLTALGHKVAVVANIVEGSTTGTAIRKMLTNPDDCISSMRMVLLYTSELHFACLKKNGIKDLLKKGYIVLCSRYYYSTYAYGGSSYEVEQVVDAAIKELPKPDKVVFLDVSVDTAVKRLTGKEKDFYETAAKLNKVRDKYMSMIARKQINDIIMINNENYLEVNVKLLTKTIVKL